MMTRRSFGGMAFAGAFAAAMKPVGALAAEGPCRLRLGVLSDIHIPTMDVATHFRKALKWFDSQKVDGVIIAGDLGYNGLIREMKVVSDVWYEVFPGDRRSDGECVEKLFITGNHDSDGYFYHQKEFPKVRFPVDPETAKDSFIFNAKRVWKELFHEEYETVKMKVVKGYKFVLHQWYPRLASDVCAERWLSPPPDTPEYNELRYACRALPEFFERHGAELVGDKPFFFIQHNHPWGTLFSPWVYGSPQGWGGHDCGASTKFLEKYPNCVSFSGHDHVTLADPRTIWQGSFTAVDTSACPGWDMAGVINGRSNMFRDPVEGTDETICDSRTPKACQLASVYDDRIVIENHELSTGKPISEARVIPWPISRGKPYAYEKRRRDAVTPEFEKGARLVRSEKDGLVLLEFPTVRVENCGVRALDYEVTCIERVEDFSRIAEQRRVYSRGIGLPEDHDRDPVKVVLTVKLLGEGDPAKLRFEVRPCDAWGNKGRPITA